MTEDFGSGMEKFKADLFKRAIAVIIDGVIAAVVANVLSIIPLIGGIIGGILGGAYFLLRDGLNLEALDGQSVGKKVMKLKVVGPSTPLDYITSIKRNITLGFVYLFYPLMIIPVLGPLLILLAALAQFVMSCIEIYKVISDPEGKRIGDNIAETKVVEI